MPRKKKITQKKSHKEVEQKAREDADEQVLQEITMKKKIVVQRKGISEDQSESILSQSMPRLNLKKFHAHEKFSFVFKKDKLFCKVCQVPLQIKNRKNHILKSKSHNKYMKETSLERQEEFKDYVQSHQETLDQKEESKTQVQDDIELANCLCFLSTKGLSFKQICEILDYFKKQYYKTNKISFIKTQCTYPHKLTAILNEMSEQIQKIQQQKLQNVFYSISVDSSTIEGLNYCCVRCRYVDDKDSQFQIKNKLLCIEDLGTDSSANQYMKILKQRVLNNSLSKANFMGITHDKAPVLAGQNQGLVGKIQDFLERPFYNQNDPCHVLSLAVKKSLKVLPNKILDLINSITAHFNYSPQNEAKFLSIQATDKEKGRRIADFVSTWWLSLRNTMEQIINLWSELTLYFNVYHRNEETINTALNDSNLKLQFEYLEVILKEIDQCNQSLMQKSTEIQILPNKIKILFEKLLKLTLKENQTIHQPSEWKPQDFAEDKTSTFVLPAQLISNIENYYDLTRGNFDFVDEFGQILLKFIKKFLFLIVSEIPFGDFLFKNSLSMQLTQNFENFALGIKELALSLKSFTPRIKLQQINKELDDLKVDASKDFWRELAVKHNLSAWCQLEKNYPNLGILFKLIQSLPVSSSDVEQSFSTLKLYRTDFRNRLSTQVLESILIIREYAEEEQTYNICQDLRTIYLKNMNTIMVAENYQEDINSKDTDISAFDKMNPNEFIKLNEEIQETLLAVDQIFDRVNESQEQMEFKQMVDYQEGENDYI